MVYRLYSYLSNLPLPIRLLLFSISYFSSAYLGKFLSFGNGAFTPYWLPSGVFVSALLLSKPKEWLFFIMAAIPANFFYDIINNRPFYISISFIIGNSLEALTGAFLIRKFVVKSITFTKLKETAGFLILSCLASTSLSALIGTLTLFFFSDSTSILQIFFSWWTGDALGILIIAPFIISFSEKSTKRDFFSIYKMIEFIILMIYLSFLSWIIFQQKQASFKFMIFPPMLFLTYRFGLRSLSFFGVIISIISVLSSINISTGHESVFYENMIMLQVFLGIFLTTCLVFYSLLTEKKFVEIQYKGSETKFELIATNIDDIFFVLDNELNFVYWNTASENFTGIKNKNIVGISVYKFYPDFRGSKIEKDFIKAIDTRKQVNLDLSYNLKEISLDFEMSIYPFGQGIAVFAKDITERKNIENKLKSNEFWMNESQKISKIGSYFINLKTGVVQTSNTLDRLLGIDENFIKDLNNFETLVCSENKQKLIERINFAINQKQPLDMEILFLRNTDKKERWCHIMGKIIDDGDGIPEKLMGTLEDITERKIAEQKQQESEFKFKSLFESMIEGVAIHEMVYNENEEPVDYKIIDVNPAFTKHTGIKADEIKGKLSTTGYDTENPPYFDIYKETVITGMPTKFETYFNNLKRHFRITVFSPGKNIFFTVFEDITEDKILQQDLKNKTEELNRFFGLTIDLLCIADTDGYFRKLNPQWEKTLGYTLDEMEGKKFFDFIHPDDIQNTLKTVRDLSNNLKVANFVNRFRCKNGTYRWIEWRSAPYGNSIYASARDITGRIKIQESLILSEARYRKLLESVTDYIYTVKKEKYGKWQTLHGPGCLNVTGYTGEEFKNDPYLWYNIIYSDDKDAVIDHSENVMRGKQESIEHRIIHKNGNVKWIRNTPVLKYDLDNNIIGYDGLISDITETKTAERALKENEDKFRTIFEYMTCAIAIYQVVENGDDFIFKDFNPTAENIEKTNKSDLIGRKVSEVFPGVKEFGIFDVFKRVYQSGRSEYFPEGIYKDERDPGSWRENWIFKLPNGDIAAIYNDITERKLSQEKIKSSLVEKEALIRELYHRTKNNMQIISSMLTLSSSYTDNEDVKTLFKDMQNRILTMSLVHQKLYQSKDLSRVNLKDYIIELTDLLIKSFMVPQNKISLEIDIEGINVMIDIAIPCGLIINELISNSLKYAFPEERTGRVKVSLHKTDDTWIDLKVSDNGIGVNEEFDFANNGKMGTKIIYAIAERQLLGKVEFENKNGLSCRIRFKETLYDKRI